MGQKLSFYVDPRILRSIINVADGVPQEILIANFQKLLDYADRLGWEPSELRIFEFCQGYFFQSNQLPSLETVVDYLTKRNDVESAERAKDLESKAPVKQTDYTFLLKSELEQQQKIEAVALLRESITIIEKGLEVKKGQKLQGIKDGILHLIEQSEPLLQEDHQGKIQGNVLNHNEIQAVWDDYQEAKRNKDQVQGALCGISNIDEVIHGVKPGELWIHSAFAGQLKTSFALNMGFNLVTKFKKSVAYVTLEMPYKQLQRMIAVMHTSHGKFTTGDGFKGRVYQPLDYERLWSGQLTPDEEEYFKVCLADLNDDPNFGRFDIWAPDEKVTIPRIQMWAQIQYQKHPFDLLVIDHAGLVEPAKKNQNYTVELNSVVRDTKLMALHFNQGKGIPVLLLSQLNREGLEHAEKNEGRFKLRALSYSNELERSGDIVTTTYLDEEHRRNGTTTFDCLKRRDGRMFQPFECRIDWRTRYMQAPLSVADELGMHLDDSELRSQEFPAMFN